MIDHNIKNYTVQVDSDVGIHDLDADLRNSDQFLPLGPFTTNYKLHEIIEYNLIGGFIETFGQPKDWIINAVISTQNVDIETGANVVKNVSGYNMTRFIAGSRGKLGKLKKVTFRTLPLKKMIVSEPCKIIDGIRLVVLPKLVGEIEQIVKNRKTQFQLFSNTGIIDLSELSDQLLNELHLFILKKYQLKNGIPIPIHNEENTQIDNLLKAMTSESRIN